MCLTIVHSYNFLIKHPNKLLTSQSDAGSIIYIFIVYINQFQDFFRLVSMPTKKIFTIVCAKMFSFKIKDFKSFLRCLKKISYSFIMVLLQQYIYRACYCKQVVFSNKFKKIQPQASLLQITKKSARQNSYRQNNKKNKTKTQTPYYQQATKYTSKKFSKMHNSQITISKLSYI